MNYLKRFCRKTLKHELLNKFIYKNTEELPEIKKIVLNFKCKITDTKHLAASVLALELIAGQKSKLTKAKRSNIFLKLRKGNPVGCKVVLRNQKMYNFLHKVLSEIIPKIKYFDGIEFSKMLEKNSISFKISNIFVFKVIEERYHLFKNLTGLNITIVTTANTNEELNFLIKSLQFPVKIAK